MESGLFSLSGKTALVTGGSRGIGLAVANGLAEHEADIAIIARTKEQLEAASRQNILSLVIYRIWNFEIQDQERRNTGT
jgi:NAD(P)-dependent dehydrogenase (short-subunit alcohol dehydrogenase family)